MLDGSIVVNEFENESHYYIGFRINTQKKGMNSPIRDSSMLVPLLLFYKADFGFK